VSDHTKTLTLEDIVGVYFKTQYACGSRPFTNESRDRADVSAEM
jgi:hypothetical protein